MAETQPHPAEEQPAQKSENGEAMVSISQLVKQFGKLRAVNDLSLTINKGETFGLIGPNGSGKTTLIRMLVGLTCPTNGTITIMGERMPSAKVAQFLGYMTQLTYANDALRGVMLKGASIASISGQLSALLIFALLMILLSALTMRRQVA